jgi:hypothetical protein
MQGAVPILRTLTSVPNAPSHLVYEKKYIAGPDKERFHVTNNEDIHRYFGVPTSSATGPECDCSYSRACDKFQFVEETCNELPNADPGSKNDRNIFVECSVPVGIARLYGVENLFFACYRVGLMGEDIQVGKNPSNGDDNEGDGRIVFRFLTKVVPSQHQHVGGSAAAHVNIADHRSSGVLVERDHLCILRTRWLAPYANGSAIIKYVLERRIIIDFHGFANNSGDDESLCKGSAGGADDYRSHGACADKISTATGSVDKCVLHTPWESINCKHCSFTEVFRFPEDINISFLRQYMLNYLCFHENIFRGMDISLQENQHKLRRSLQNGGIWRGAQGSDGTSRAMQMTRMLDCYFRLSAEIRVCAINDEGASETIQTQVPIHLCDILVEQLLCQDMLDIQSSFVRTLETVQVRAQTSDVYIVSPRKGRYAAANTPGSLHQGRRSTPQRLGSSGFVFPAAANDCGVKLHRPVDPRGDDSSAASAATGTNSAATAATNSTVSVPCSSQNRRQHGLPGRSGRRQALTPMGNTAEDIEREIHKASQIIQSRRLRKLEGLLESATSALPQQLLRNKKSSGFGGDNLTAQLLSDYRPAGNSGNTGRSNHRKSKVDPDGSSNEKSYASELMKGRTQTSISAERVGQLLKDFLAPPPSVQGTARDSSVSISSMVDVEALLKRPQHRWESQSEASIRAYEEAHSVSMEATAFELAEMQLLFPQHDPKPHEAAANNNSLADKVGAHEEQDDDTGVCEDHVVLNHRNTRFIDFKKSESFGFPRRSTSWSADLRSESGRFDQVTATTPVFPLLSDTTTKEPTGGEVQSGQGPVASNDFESFLKRLEQACPLR